MRIVRLYSDRDGESHFEDVEIELRLTDYAPPAPPLYVSRAIPTTQAGFMKAPAGWSSDWHPSAARNMFFVLSGDRDCANRVPLLSVIAVAPSGLAYSVVDPGLAKPRRGLNSDRCYAARWRVTSRSSKYD